MKAQSQSKLKIFKIQMTTNRKAKTQFKTFKFRMSQINKNQKRILKVKTIHKVILMIQKNNIKI